MQMASKVFMDMIGGAQDTGEAIPLEENSETMLGLLDTIHPNGAALDFTGKKFEYICSLLAAADKYDISKVADEIRIRLLSDPYFKSYPLESYAIACKYSWKKEIAATTANALLNVNEIKSQKIFTQLDAVHIMRLHKLVEMRRQHISKAIRMCNIIPSSPGRYYVNDPYKETVFSLVEFEIVKCPSGRTLQEEFWTRADLRNYIPGNGVENLRERLNTCLKDLPSDVSAYL